MNPSGLVPPVLPVFESVASKFEGRVGIIHSNKEQNHRFNTVRLFKEGVYQFLIATDIVARGIDIAEVTHVINFDTPDVPENYIHRIGRTGRFDKKGIAIATADGVLVLQQLQPPGKKAMAVADFLNGRADWFPVGSIVGVTP